MACMYDTANSGWANDDSSIYMPQSIRITRVRNRGSWRSLGKKIDIFDEKMMRARGNANDGGQEREKTGSWLSRLICNSTLYSLCWFVGDGNDKGWFFRSIQSPPMANPFDQGTRTCISLFHFSPNLFISFYSSTHSLFFPLFSTDSPTSSPDSPASPASCGMYVRVRTFARIYVCPCDFFFFLEKSKKVEW